MYMYVYIEFAIHSRSSFERSKIHIRSRQRPHEKCKYKIILSKMKRQNRRCKMICIFDDEWFLVCRFRLEYEKMPLNTILFDYFNVVCMRICVRFSSEVGASTVWHLNWNEQKFKNIHA